MNLKKIKDLSILINKYVKEMKWKPNWSLAYSGFLWATTLDWMTECGLNTRWAEEAEIWNVAVQIATQVENIKNG